MLTPAGRLVRWSHDPYASHAHCSPSLSSLTPSTGPAPFLIAHVGRIELMIATVCSRSSFRLSVVRTYSSAHERFRVRVGPPDEDSNIVPVWATKSDNKNASLGGSGYVHFESCDATVVCVLRAQLQEDRLRELQLKVWRFNHEFWKNHNREFQQVGQCARDLCSD